MTYTFKLARRLAVSRSCGMLPAIILFAACSGGDAIAPDGSPTDVPESGIYDWRPRESTPVAVHINPSNVTVETNQLIRFRANGRNRAGDTVAASVVWSTTGGTILPDGRFSAATVGTYQILGMTRAHENRPVVDTSVVTVVRRQVGVASLEITPGAMTLTPGVSQLFSAVGHLKNGKPVQIGTYWSSTGGSIDAGGTYLAGDTAGSYRVIATNTSGTLADTAVITIAAPPSPPPPPADSLPAPTPPIIPLEPPDTTPAPPDTAPTPPPPPPPAPILASVTLLPAGATLAPSSTRQFTAYGRNTSGDSVPVSVVFKATGGTVTSGGLYTAGSVAGTFRVIATSGAFADSSTVTVTAPLGSGPPTAGVPFGTWGVWNGSTTYPNTDVFTASLGAVNESNIISRIDAARSRHVKVFLAMSGGDHDLYLSTINGVYQFDSAKWKAKMNTFNTVAIKTAIAAGVADGTIIGNSVMDEPHVHGTGDGNTWGPAGTMTKVRVDSLCGYVKDMFPTLPTGVVHRHDIFEPTKSYRVCDFIISQYSDRLGSVTAFRDGGLAMGQRDGIAIAFSMNVLNGGTQDLDGTWDCVGTGGMGTRAPNCQMTAKQLTDFGSVLGPVGCAFAMWQYNSDYMARSANQLSFRDLAGRLATAPAKPCRK
jgi:hypothetical protein